MSAKPNSCEIYGLVRGSAFLWKWRHRDAGGREQVCPQEYKRFAECAAAARASGYEPRTDWTGPCALVSTRPGQAGR